MNRMTKLLRHRLLGVCACRAEERDFDRLFHRATYAHDLAPQGLQVMRGQWARIALGNFFQYLRFTFRAKDGLLVFLLHMSDGLREFGAFVEQGDELGVERVDLDAQWREFRIDGLQGLVLGHG